MGRFLRDGSPLDLYALAGILAGSANRRAKHENLGSVYEALQRFVQAARDAGQEGEVVHPDDLVYDSIREVEEPAAPLSAGCSEDLSSEVTVFVTTVGYATFERCMEHLKAQDCSSRLEVIEGVAPMSAAFQQILDRCTTPFYVQVDEDMILYPQAVRMLYERIRRADGNVAQYVACLYDEHLGRAIYGLKIFRTEVTRRYPLRDVEGFEWEQVGRWRRDGYVDLREDVAQADRNPPRTLGLHGTLWTPLSIYVRYFVLEHTRRKGNKTHQWVALEAQKLLEKYLLQGSELNLFALGGILAGRLQERLGAGRSKHFERYERTPGFEEFQRFAAEIR